MNRSYCYTLFFDARVVLVRTPEGCFIRIKGGPDYRVDRHFFAQMLKGNRRAWKSFISRAPLHR